MATLPLILLIVLISVAGSVTGEPVHYQQQRPVDHRDHHGYHSTVRRKTMKKFLLLCALSVRSAACSVCGFSTIPTSPSSIANTTKLDEQAALTAQLAYKSWRIAVETGVNAGLIKGQLATHVAQLDNQLYSALQAVDAAYSAAGTRQLRHRDRELQHSPHRRLHRNRRTLICSPSQEF
jgi:hypothetical protein